MPVHAVAWFVAIMLAVFTTNEAVASADYCKDNGEGKNIIFLVDVTTPYDDIDKNIINETVQNLWDDLSGGDKFSIITIEDIYVKSEKLFDGCVPYCKSDGFISDLFSSCTGGVILQEQRRIKNRLTFAVRERLDNFVELDHSDIVRTVHEVSRQNDRKNVTKYVVFSDLIENSEYISGGEFQKIENQVLIDKIKEDNLLPTFNGAVVEVSGFGRAGTNGRPPLSVPLSKKIKQFWFSLLKNGGAQDINIGLANN